nr:hypothetical protein [Lentzea jiangxiensis]
MGSVGADHQVRLDRRAVGEADPRPAVAAGAHLRHGPAEVQVLADGVRQQRAQRDAVDVDARAAGQVRAVAEHAAAVVEEHVAVPQPQRRRRRQQPAHDLRRDEPLQRRQGPLVEGDVVPAGRGDVGVAVEHRHLVTTSAQPRSQGEPADPSSDHDHAHIPTSLSVADIPSRATLAAVVDTERPVPLTR